MFLGQPRETDSTLCALSCHLHLGFTLNTVNSLWLDCETGRRLLGEIKRLFPGIYI